MESQTSVKDNLKVLQQWVRRLCGPVNHDKTALSLTCKIAFEPGGYASEDWDPEWILTLIPILHHSKFTTGWKVGTSKNPISFKGLTAEEAIQRAVSFMRDCPTPVMREDW